MNKPDILFDYKLRPLYVAIGDYRSLIPILNFKSGWRRCLESAFFNLQYFFKRKESDTNVMESLQNQVKEPIEAALLFNTGWYKDTSWIGVVKTESNNLFVKVYKNYEDAVFNLQQMKFVKEHFAGEFVLPSLYKAEANSFITQAVSQTRAVNSEDHIEERLISISHELLKKKIEKSVAEIIPLNIKVFSSDEQFKPLNDRIAAWSVGNAKTFPLVPVHGDMTPWNMFVSKDEKLMLVDYERAGWHVPFYDVFHYVLQPWALRQVTKDLKTLIFKKDWYQNGWLNDALILYLIDQLYNDMTDFNVKKYRHAHLQQAITHKMAWLNEAFDAAKAS